MQSQLGERERETGLLQEEIARLEGEDEEKVERLSELAVDLVDAREARDGLERDLEEAKEELERAEERIQAMADVMKEEFAEKEGLKGRVAQLEEEVSGLRREVRRLSSGVKGMGGKEEEQEEVSNNIWCELPPNICTFCAVH